MSTEQAAAAPAAKDDTSKPMWQRMGWGKPGRKSKKAGEKSVAKAKKAAPKAAKARKNKKGTKKATLRVKAALAKTKTAAKADGSDVRSLLVQAIKQAVDTGDYENARQILGLLEKQR